MYDQKLEFQSGSSTRGGGGGNDRPTDRRGELPHVKLIKFADGKVRPVDENGKPLGIYTKSLVAPPKRVHDFILQDQSCKLLPKHRVCNCLKKRIDKNKNRTVKYNVDRKKSHWSNVQRCASLWVCPVCAKPITEGRRTELSIGLEH